jgi:hypothetical protein
MATRFLKLRYVIPATALAGGTIAATTIRSVVRCKTGVDVSTTNKAEGDFDVVIVGSGCGGSAVGSQLLAKSPAD